MPQRRRAGDRDSSLRQWSAKHAEEPPPRSVAAQRTSLCESKFTEAKPPHEGDLLSHVGVSSRRQTVIELRAHRSQRDRELLHREAGRIGFGCGPQLMQKRRRKTRQERYCRRVISRFFRGSKGAARDHRAVTMPCPRLQDTAFPLAAATRLASVAGSPQWVIIHSPNRGLCISLCTRLAFLVRPPGPKSRGIVGNLPMASKDPLGVFTQWARQYGDIFYYRVFHRHIYFLNHPDLVKHVLVTNYQNFIKGEAIRFNRRMFGNGLISNEGSSWLQQRRLIQPAFHRERIESYGDTMVAYAVAHDSSMARRRRARHPSRHDAPARWRLLARTLFNIEIAGERDHIAVALNTLMELSSGARMLLPPLLRRAPTQGNLRYLQAARRLDDIVYALIRERRASGKVLDDLLSTLLDARDESGAPMPDKQVRDEVMTILLAGHETAAVSLSWTWYLLAQNPEVEQKLCSELRDVLNGRSPQVRDLPELRYTERVVKEAMRLYPPVWALVRNPINDCEIGGYRVPAGSSVIMSPWVMHRDPQHYDEPERFNPDRWLDERTTAASKFSYFPFGGGPRSCIGASFAMMEAVLVLATIAQRFKIGVVQDRPVEPLPTITFFARSMASEPC